MTIKASILKASKHRCLMRSHLEKANEALKNKFGDGVIVIVENISDGFVFLFDGDHNAPMFYIDANKLMLMNKVDALEYLRAYSI